MPAHAFGRPPRAGLCPCGTGLGYEDCCAPLHRQERLAAGVEELMRSRYSAYALGDLDHVFRTWHPRTRPDNLSDDLQHGTEVTWIALEVLDTEQGESTGTVEFRAHYRGEHGTAVLHERSRFEKRGGRWVYVDGVSY